MEIIIIIAVLGLAAYWVYDMSQKKQDTKSDQPWPFGTALPEGKIHVKSADVAPGKSADDRVEEPAPSTVAETMTTVVENKPAKKPATKKGAHEGNKAPAKKPAAAKKAPAKKKSV